MNDQTLQYIKQLETSCDNRHDVIEELQRDLDGMTDLCANRGMLLTRLREVIAKHDTEVINWKEMVEKSERYVRQLQGDLANAMDVQAKNHHRIDNLRNNAISDAGVIADQAEQLRVKDATIARLNATVANYETAVATVNDETVVRQETIKSLRDMLAEREKTINGLHASIAWEQRVAESNYSDFRGYMERDGKTIIELTNANLKLNEEIDKRDETIKILENGKQWYETMLKISDARIANLVKILSEQASTIATLRSAVSDQRDTIDLARSQLDERINDAASLRIVTSEQYLTIERQNKAISERDATIANLKRQLDAS